MLMPCSRHELDNSRLATYYNELSQRGGEAAVWQLQSKLVQTLQQHSLAWGIRIFYLDTQTCDNI